MDPVHALLAAAATRLAADLPTDTLEVVAAAVHAGAGAGRRAVQGIPHPHYRGLAAGFLDLWAGRAADVPPAAVALALCTASHAEQARRAGQALELAWTGPGTDAHPFRRTEQAVLQVLDSARRRVTLVSYAVYRVPHVRAALVRAARRGVSITVILETPDRVEGEGEYSTLRALGEEVAGCSAVFYWPKANRTTSGGKAGSLHVKCAVADGRLLFLSSANLTEYAFTVNMELGLLGRAD